MLLDWIDETKLQINQLCLNSNAIEYLCENIEKIDSIEYLIFNDNPEVIYLIQELLKQSKYWNVYNNLLKKDVMYGISSLKESPEMIEFIIRCIDMNSKHLEYINWYCISKNRYAEELLTKYDDYISLEGLMQNANTRIIETIITEKIKEEYKILKKINVEHYLVYETFLYNLKTLNINTNPKAIELLKLYPEYINWHLLSTNENPEAIKLLRENPEKINWFNMSSNSCDEAIDLLKENEDKINFDKLFENKNQRINYLIVEFIKTENLNENDVRVLCNSSSIEIIQLLYEKYKGKIDWINLCKNEVAIDIIEENKYNIFWPSLSGNPCIFIKPECILK